MKKRHGFTLIELLITITIIGILAGVGLASYTRAQARGRDARRQADFQTLRNSLELYYAENRSYINTSNAWRAVSTSLSPLVPTYIKVLPADPAPSSLGIGEYRYRSVSGAQGYCLEAKLEATGGSNTCTVGLQSGYNYGVGNP